MSTDRTDRSVKHTNHSNPLMIVRCEACTDDQKVDRLQELRESVVLQLKLMAPATLANGWARVRHTPEPICVN